MVIGYNVVMKKLAIILDSFCGKNKHQVESHQDFYFIPLKVIADGVEYLDGVDKPTTELFSILNHAKEVKTSQPSPATFEETFTKLSNEYETVIYLSLSSSLSGTYQTASMIAQDFKNVFVINNHMVGSAFFVLGEYLVKKAETASQKDLIALATDYVTNEVTPTYVIPRDIDAFIRGGRLGKAVAFVLEKLKAVPIISYEDEEKLHKKMVKRSGSSAIDYAIEKMAKMAEEVGNNVIFQVCHTLDDKFAKEAKAKLEALGYRVDYELTSSIINAHTGDGAHSIGFYKKLD